MRISFPSIVIVLCAFFYFSNPASADHKDGKKGKKVLEHPNIMIIMVDEQRFPTVYENGHPPFAPLKNWINENLPNQMAIKAQSTEMLHHYIGSCACAPSRTTFFTGHYPTLHGVRFTDGVAKSAHGDDMYWLDPNTVPTIGDYFRKGGYRTLYRGKWHISHEDLEVPVSRDVLASNDDDGNVLTREAELYLNSGRLEDYGFTGWVGPEPHGSQQSNAGILRDPITADQVIQTFDELEDSEDESPFLLVSSFLNPHDIATYGLLWGILWGYNYTDGSVPFVPPPPTKNENLTLSNKPTCQQDYIDKYADFFVPQPQLPVYRQFYYYLQKLVDEQIGRVWNRLQESRFADNTIVIFTSDHGDMLGAHGGMHQKWYQAYEETVHVPMYISGPGIPAGASSDILSSHVDVLPTLLGLANLDGEMIRRELEKDHTEAQQLIGRDLTNVLFMMDDEDLPIYFMSEDEISEGLDQQSADGEPFEAVIEPAKVEAIVLRLDNKLWKFVRTYEVSLIPTNPPTAPTVQPQFELYNLNVDRTEINNLADNVTIAQFLPLLIAEREKKAKSPENTGQCQLCPGEPI